MIKQIWGAYKNELGSDMIIKDMGESKFEGKYRTAAGHPSPQQEFHLFGTYVDCGKYVLLCWTVNWEKSVKSITTWNGTATKNKEGRINIVANYLLTTTQAQDWLLSTAIAGQDQFQKN